MKVALLHDSVLPVQTYGGIERVVQSLAEELPKLGHDVVLITRESSDIEVLKRTLPRVEAVQIAPDLYRSALWWKELKKRIPAEVDLIHSHQPLISLPDVPTLITVHGNAQPGEVFWPQTSFVSRSHAANHNAKLFVYNGIDPSRYPFVPAGQRRDHFVFLAKAKWSVKNLASAIAFAEHHRVPLEVIGGTGRNSRYVTYRGIIGEAEGKLDILSTARALLYPTNWQEPFGIAVIEALACGVPVIASENGAMPELIDASVGITCRDYGEFLASIHSIDSISREACRLRVEDQFTTAQMAKNYTDLYQLILRGGVSEAKPRYTENLERVQRIDPPGVWSFLRTLVKGSIGR